MTPPKPAKPDAILFWNAVVLEADRIAHSEPDKRQQNGPTLSSRAFAIVHLAMYDAFAGIVGVLGIPKFPRYLDPAPPPPSMPEPPETLSPRDAVAGAAHWTLSELYSAQGDFFDAQLSAFNTDNQSFAFGQDVGRALLRMRANDMDSRDCGYLPSPDRGRHRRDPDNPTQMFYSAFYGAQNQTFAVSQRHDLDAPPFDQGDAAEERYLQALRDARARGIKPDLTATLPAGLFDRRRSAEETLTGIYWGYDGANGVGTPPRLYNQIIRHVAMNVKNPPDTGTINDESDNARLFAFVNAALGDAGILAWEQKYCHDFWRPVVGIREHDEEFGPAAPHDKRRDFNEGDPGWLPLGAQSTNRPGMKNFTPDFPAYPSGHATFAAAAFHITRLFYGVKEKDEKKNDKLFPGHFVSDELNGGNRDNTGTVRPRHTRSFPGGLWEMIIENAASRIPLGVHWFFDAFDFTVENDECLIPSLENERIGGVGLGLRIARDIFKSGEERAPKVSPLDPTKPPITTPCPGEPMPARPEQPASVKGCADNRGGGGPGKKATAENGATRRARPDRDSMADQPGAKWPSGVSEQGGEQPSAPGAWPSGVSKS